MRNPLTSLAAMALLATLSLPASAEIYSCKIGKPSYCYKYGGNLCQQWNKAPGTVAACEKWTAACLDCHAEIPSCLGNKRPPSDAPICATCNARWLSCMKKIDRRFWPNRMQRKVESAQGLLMLTRPRKPAHEVWLSKRAVVLVIPASGKP